MVNTRNLAITISWAVLSVAPWICAQEVKPFATGLIPERPLAIQRLELLSPRLFRFSLGAERVVAEAVIPAQDFSSYRGFRFGMDLPTVAKLADVRPSDAKLVHRRPALIEELDWRPSFSIGSSHQTDSVQEVLFCFYNGALFRMVITYDRDRIEGLTDEDMVEGISSKYGTATRPAQKIVFFSALQAYSSDGEKVIARWEDPQYSFNLFRSSYQPTFGMLAFSKRMDPLAHAAILEAVRLDALEAPQREMDSQKQQDEEQANARRVNRTNFRP